MAFVTACKESLLDQGEVVPCRVEGKEILIVWADGGEPRAFDALCPHARIPLSRGVFSGRTLTCTAHGWVFDGRTGKGLQPAGCALREYPMRIHGGVVEVDLAV